MAQKCHRCGLCCNQVGRTFWKHGCLKLPNLFYDCDELNLLANNGDHEDNGLPCEWLEYDEKGLAVCGIEKKFGRKYKPAVCKSYPEEDEKCFYYEVFVFQESP